MMFVLLTNFNVLNELCACWNKQGKLLDCWMAGYSPSSFFAFLFISVSPQNPGQYLAILTDKAWSVKDLLYVQNIDVFLRDTARNLKQARSGSRSDTGSCQVVV